MVLLAAIASDEARTRNNSKSTLMATLKTDGSDLASLNSARSAGAGAWNLARICLVASLGGILFGFDTAVISGTVEQVRIQFALSDLMLGWFTSSALVGCMLGAAVAGFLADRFGRKPILFVAAILFLVSGIYSMIAGTFETLVIVRLVCGIGIGVASVIAPTYISEFAPPKWRGRLVGLYQLFIVIGILLAYFSNWIILRFAQANPGAFGGTGLWHQWLVRESWRGMFGAEVLPAVLFLLLLFYVPESPRWLIKAGREAAGLEILAQLNGSHAAEVEITEIRKRPLQEGGYVGELFRPGLRRALILGVMLSVFGQLSGVNIVVYYGPKILMAAGYHDAGALLGQIGFGFINLIFTILALTVIDRWGRRPLLIGGMAVVTLTMGVIGFLFLQGGISSTLAATGGTIPAWVALSITTTICIYIAAIALSICAVIWVVTPEIFPTRVRGSAASIVTFANWGTNALSALVFPWYVATFGMHSFFFTTAAICLLATLFFWKSLPETKGCSLEEIEGLWQR
jgi:SP family arabinose:H+ symporter-like MFS transporter